MGDCTQIKEDVLQLAHSALVVCHTAVCVGDPFGSTNAFLHYNEAIDSYYVSGISLTHGEAGSRHHISTFAAGQTEVSRGIPLDDCPCDTANYDRVPTFVGHDFVRVV